MAIYVRKSTRVPASVAAILTMNGKSLTGGPLSIAPLNILFKTGNRNLVKFLPDIEILQSTKGNNSLSFPALPQFDAPPFKRKYKSFNSGRSWSREIICTMTVSWPPKFGTRCRLSLLRCAVECDFMQSKVGWESPITICVSLEVKFTRKCRYTFILLHLRLLPHHSWIWRQEGEWSPFLHSLFRCSRSFTWSVQYHDNFKRLYAFVNEFWRCRIIHLYSILICTRERLCIGGYHLGAGTKSLDEVLLFFFLF